MLNRAGGTGFLPSLYRRHWVHQASVPSLLQQSISRSAFQDCQLDTCGTYKILVLGLLLREALQLRY